MLPLCVHFSNHKLIIESVCCLLVLNAVTFTPQWIRQPKAAWWTPITAVPITKLFARGMYVYKLNFGKVSIGCQCGLCAAKIVLRAGWLHSRGALCGSVRCVARDAMQCAGAAR